MIHDTLWELRWWSRWWVKHFPRLAYQRLTTCRHEHAGPYYDGTLCLCCGAPWFGRRRA